MKKIILACVGGALFLALLYLLGVSIGITFLLGQVLAIYILIKMRKAEHRWVYWILAMGYAAFLLSFLVIGGLIVSDNNHEDVRGDYDYVVLFGAALHGDEPSQTLLDRLEAGVNYLRDYEEVPVIVSGGQGSGESISEAEAMGRYLIDHGISKDRIFYEKNATTTYENLVYSKSFMEEQANPRVLLITSDYHVFRAKLVAKEVGLKADGLGGTSPLFVRMNYVVREYAAVIKTWIEQGV